MSEAAVGVASVTVQRDARGSVFEPLGGELLARQRNLHVVLSEPGAIRGNHYHTRGPEVLAVLGPALVRCRDAGGIRDFEVPPGEVWRFEIPAGVPHAVRHTGSLTGLLVSMRETPHDPADPDTLREILIPSQPQ